MHQSATPAREMAAAAPSWTRRLRRIAGAILTPLAAIAAALLVSGLILLLSGYDPVVAFTAMWQGAFADMRTVTEVLIKATPLIIIASGLAVAFRASIWNIGAEGQFYVGAVAATAVGIYLNDLPGIVHIPLVLAAAIAGGALWGMLAGWLKVKFGASEIVTTIMLNYIAIIGTGFLVTGPMIEARASIRRPPRSQRLRCCPVSCRRPGCTSAS